MTKDELKQMLREELSISISQDCDYGSKIVKITIDFDGEEICSDFIVVSND